MDKEPTRALCAAPQEVPRSPVKLTSRSSRIWRLQKMAMCLLMISGAAIGISSRLLWAGVPHTAAGVQWLPWSWRWPHSSSGSAHSCQLGASVPHHPAGGWPSSWMQWQRVPRSYKATGGQLSGTQVIMTTFSRPKAITRPTQGQRWGNRPDLPRKVCAFKAFKAGKTCRIHLHQQHPTSHSGLCKPQQATQVQGFPHFQNGYRHIE